MTAPSPMLARWRVAGGWRWIVFAVVALSQFMVLLDATVVNIAAPAIRHAFDVPPERLAWVIDAYTLLFGGFVLAGGRAADAAGQRRTFCIGLLLFTGASVVCGVSQGYAELVGGRALQGVGAALLVPAAMAIATRLFPAEHERRVALGMLAGLGALGATAGVVLGGVIVQHWGWRWVFLINLAPGAVSLAIAAALVPPHERAERKSTGLLGIVLLTATLLSFVFAITCVRSAGWVGRPVVAGLALALLGAVLLVRTESTGRDPLLPARLRRSAGLRAGAIGQFLVGAIQLSSMLLLSIEVQQGLGLSPEAAALLMLPMGLAAIAAALTASRLLRRFGSRPVASAGALLAAAGLVGAAGLAHGPAWPLSVAGVMVGFSLPLSSVTHTAFGLAAIRTADAGFASGLLNTSFQAGGSVAVAVSSSLGAMSPALGYAFPIAAAFGALANAYVGFVHQEPPGAGDA